MNRSALVSRDDDSGTRYYVSLNLVDGVVNLRASKPNGSDVDIAFEAIPDLPEPVRMDILNWFLLRMDE